MLSISPALARLSRIHASCTASAASLVQPSLQSATARSRAVLVESFASKSRSSIDL